MLTFRGKVRYTDETEEEFVAGTAALAAYEEYAIRHGYPYGQETPTTLGALVMAHRALRAKEGFDVWRERVFGIELEADGVPPTLPAQSDGSGSPSPLSSAYVPPTSPHSRT